MPIKRFYPIKDTTITNAVKIGENKRAKEANMGKSDSLEIFYIVDTFNEPEKKEDEESRIIMRFDVNEISSSAENLEFPPHEARFYLRMFNVKHDKPVPSSFNAEVYAMDQDFKEGYGIDMETYQDVSAANWNMYEEGYQKDNEGNFLLDEENNKILEHPWTEPGAGTGTGSIGDFYFEKGTEDLLIDITDHVSPSWYGLRAKTAEDDENDPPYLEDSITVGEGGLMIKVSDIQQDFYTKKFYSRTTNNFYKKPCIEVRWESVVQDDGGSLYKYTDRLSAEDNEQTLYLYNWVDGELKQIPEPVAYFKTWPNEDFTGTPATIAATNVSTGVYKVDYTPESGVNKIYYTWERTNDERYLSGSIDLIDREYGNDFATPDYNITINNLKDSYSTAEKANMRLSIKKRDKDLNIYTVAQSNFQNDIIKRIYYKVTRRADNFDAIPYGIGENNMPEFTKLSYDSTGNYFDLDMSLFEPGFMYEISFLYKVKTNYVEYRNKFKFRVE